MDGPPFEILMPQDFADHIDVYHKLPLKVLTRSGPLDQDMLTPSTEDDNTVDFLAEVNGMDVEDSNDVSQPGDAHFVRFEAQERGESEARTHDAEDSATPSPTSRASDDRADARNSETGDSRQNSMEFGSPEDAEPEPVPSLSPSLKLDVTSPSPSPQRPASQQSGSSESVGEIFTTTVNDL